MENKNIDLATMAALGEMFSKQQAEKGIDTKGIFDKCIEEARAEEPDPVKTFALATSKYQREMLKTFPLFNRLNYILNNIANLKKEKGDITDNDINWEYVNKVLFSDPIPYDFNLVDKVCSLNELYSVHSSVIQSQIIGGPWYKQTCKTCSETFYLAYKELKFYEEKDLHVPKRCKDCIDESKGKVSRRQMEKQTKPVVRTTQENTCPKKTAFELAFEKANKKKG